MDDGAEMRGLLLGRIAGIHSARVEFPLAAGAPAGERTVRGFTRWNAADPQARPRDARVDARAEPAAELPSLADAASAIQDSGRDAKNPRSLDQVHAAGAQVGLTYVPWMAFLNFHYDYEFYSEDRPQGQVFTLTLGKQF